MTEQFSYTETENGVEYPVSPFSYPRDRTEAVWAQALVAAPARTISGASTTDSITRFQMLCAALENTQAKFPVTKENIDSFWEETGAFSETPGATNQDVVVEIVSSFSAIYSNSD